MAFIHWTIICSVPSMLYGSARDGRGRSVSWKGHWDMWAREAQLGPKPWARCVQRRFGQHGAFLIGILCFWAFPFGLAEALFDWWTVWHVPLPSLLSTLSFHRCYSKEPLIFPTPSHPLLPREPNLQRGTVVKEEMALCGIHLGTPTNENDLKRQRKQQHPSRETWLDSFMSTREKQPTPKMGSLKNK